MFPLDSLGNDLSVRARPRNRRLSGPRTRGIDFGIEASTGTFSRSCAFNQRAKRGSHRGRGKKYPRRQKRKGKKKNQRPSSSKKQKKVRESANAANEVTTLLERRTATCWQPDEPPTPSFCDVSSRAFGFFLPSFLLWSVSLG